MGNCGNLCNKNFKYKGDIIIDKLLIEQNEYHCIYSYNLSQIIYLQKEIKHFLKRKKIHKSSHSSNKSTKQTGNKRKTNQEKNLIKEIEICRENVEEEPPDESGLLIQILKPTLLEKNVFEGDAFKIGIKNTKLENDPRDSKESNIRKKYPKITENQSSYTGEWMNGKRDGLGLLSLENEVQFLGYFIENKVEGYGHLWKERGDSYKGEWKNYQAEGWGIYQTIEGAYFRGNWIRNKQNGFGVERWPRGSIFLEIIFWEIKVE